MKRIKNLNRSGFTIVELLIVVVVIGILAGLVFVQFQNVRGRARDSERKADVRLIESKLAEYYADESSYPLTLAELQTTTNMPDDALRVGDSTEGYTYAPTVDETGGACTTLAADCGYYSITATLEEDTDPYVRTSE